MKYITSYVPAIASFAIHLFVSLRWLIIDMTKGNMKGIPLDVKEIVPFLLVLLTMASVPWAIRTIRLDTPRILRVVTCLNIIAFGFTAALLGVGAIYIVGSHQIIFQSFLMVR